MPFGVQRGWLRYALPRPEILQYPLETNIIDSVVLNSAGIAPDASGPYMNRRYLIAGTVLSKRSDNTYERFTNQSAAAAVPQQQTVTLVGPPTGGTFILGLNGGQTGPQPYNVTAANLATAIGGLPATPGGAAIGAANVTVTLANNVYTVTFATAVGHELPLMESDPTALTGPGNQDVVVAETQQYGGGGTQAVAGVLFDTVEFADGSELSDEPVAMLRRNVSFKASAIVDFATYQTQIVNGLPDCEFV